MKIGIVFEYPSLNGGEQSMLAILRHLSHNSGLGSDLTLIGICPQDGRLREELAALIPVCTWNPRSPAGQRRPIPELVEELSRLTSQLSLNALHANSLSMARITGALKRSGILPSSIKITGHIRDIMKLPNAGLIDLNANDHLIAVSSAARDSLIAQGIDPLRCSVIYNGIDPAFCPRDDNTINHTLRDSIGVPRDAFLILNVGQICLRKGQLDLAQAVIPLLQDFPQIHLVHLGERYSSKAESIRYAEQVEEIFALAGFSDRLHLTGFSSQVFDWMKTADLLAHTPRQEPFGRVLLEAAICRLPILATNVGGTSEMLRPNIDAELLPSGDVEAIEQGLRKLMESPHLRSTRAHNAEIRVRECFSISQSAGLLKNVWLNN